MREQDLPSYASVCNYLDGIPSAALVLAREGERAHNERMLPHLRRKYTDVAANQIWVADTMIFDVMVRNDYFLPADNAAVRLQLTALMDLRSRKIVGYAFCLNGSSRSITTALIAAVKRYGPCESFYCDNGKDFKKVGKFARPLNRAELIGEDMDAITRSGALRQLGIAVQYCIKFRPQSKPIERFFGTLHRRFDAEFPHYTTGNAYLKPDATVAAAAQHSKVLAMARPDLSPLIPASQFVALAQHWIEVEYNAQHRHSGEGMTVRTPEGKICMTPDEAFAPALDNRRAFDPAVLDTLLWQREERLVRRSAVEVNGRRLVGTSAFATEQLYRANETRVIVCFDPLNPGEGIVVDRDGRKLCDVRSETLVEHGASAGPMISASLQMDRGLTKNTRASWRGLRRDVSKAGFAPAVEHMREAAMLPMAVGDHVVQRVDPRPAAPETKQFHSEDIGDALAASLMRSN